METVFNYPIHKKYIYNDPNRFLVSWWRIDSYFNNEPIQISDFEIMTAAYGSSLSFGSRLRSKYIGHKTYAYIRSNFGSKPTPIHWPVQKSDLNYSYLRSQFSGLPQTVAKKLIYHLSQIVSYDSKIIYPVINGFSPNEVSSHLHICDHPIVTIGIIGLCLEFSNISHVDSLEGFRKSVVYKVRT